MIRLHGGRQRSGGELAPLMLWFFQHGRFSLPRPVDALVANGVEPIRGESHAAASRFAMNRTAYHYFDSSSFLLMGEVDICFDVRKTPDNFGIGDSGASNNMEASQVIELRDGRNRPNRRTVFED